MGDEAAFSQIYKHYWPTLYAAAYNHVRATEVAEDMVQDLFANLWLKRKGIIIHGSLQAYLYTAIRHRIYDYFDKQRVRQQVHEQLAYQSPVASNATDQKVGYAELQVQFVNAVEQLPPLTKTIFCLSRYDYLSTQDIAGQLNLSTKAVEYHLNKALKFLRNHLKEFIVPALVISWLLNL